ncbi:MAG TPA: acetyl-coenzyme A synthetase N-terminal domain-containing protein, partial [Longimicrobium sp.]|nr:acetyl-coenzyme A synthetase N-terminal domain-containing protein [Longimicrobium sp.]
MSSTEPTLDSLLQEDRSFPPPPEFAARANASDPALYAQADADPEVFWAGWARRLHWFTPWERVLEWNPPYARWFAGGTLNAAYNCLDRHVEGGLGVADAVPQALRAESAEDHRVRRADAGARQHGDGGLGDHGEVDGHAVALPHAQLAQRVRRPGDLAVEFGVGVRAPVAGLALPQQGRLPAEAALHVPVQAVVRGVQRPPGEPPGVGRIPLQHALPRREPVQ